MVEILRQIIQAKNKAWDKTLNDTQEKFLVKLDLTVLNELVEKKSQFQSNKKKETAKQTRAAKRSIREESNERLMHAGNKYSSIRTRKAASESRSNLVSLFNNKSFDNRTVYVIENVNRLRNLKFLYKNKDVGFFFVNNTWMMVPGLKNLMSKKDIERLGSLRYATFIIYLNDGFTGGETEFPKKNMKATDR